MYNTKYICSYNPFNENLDIQDTLYRKDLINIFMIDEFNETVINKSLQQILNKVQNHPEINMCMKKMAGFMISEDLGIGLLLLYSFDLLYLTHPCICDFLETGTIQPGNLTVLLKSFD
jgi:hypothetical protein